MEKRDVYAKEEFGESYEQSKLGAKLRKAFMAEVGEEMRQAEVAHHASGRSGAVCMALEGPDGLAGVTVPRLGAAVL